MIQRSVVPRVNFAASSSSPPKLIATEEARPAVGIALVLMNQYILGGGLAAGLVVLTFIASILHTGRHHKLLWYAAVADEKNFNHKFSPISKCQDMPIFARFYRISWHLYFTIHLLHFGHKVAYYCTLFPCVVVKT